MDRNFSTSSVTKGPEMTIEAVKEMIEVFEADKRWREYRYDRLMGLGLVDPTNYLRSTIHLGA